MSQQRNKVEKFNNWFSYGVGFSNTWHGSQIIGNFFLSAVSLFMFQLNNPGKSCFTRKFTVIRAIHTKQCLHVFFDGGFSVVFDIFLFSC